MFFSTDRLISKKITLADQNGYFHIFSASDVAEFDEFDPITFEDAGKDIEGIIAKYEIDNSTECEIGVYPKDQHDLVGVLYYKIEHDTIFIGYHFNGLFRGQGYARESVQGLITYLNNKFSLPIVAKVDSENSRSIHLLEKLGFLKDENYEDSQFFKGKNHIEWLFTLPI
jgi:ribosomal-protein-alanine N-acetyltransferase